VKKSKAELRQKMSVIASSDIHNDENDEVTIDRKTFEKIKDIDIEDDDFVESDESDDEKQEKADNLMKRK
jgi:hypothetical protein